MKDLFENVYEGKKVFVTGHTGFKGSWLVYWLKNLGADVVGYSKDIPTKPSHFELVKPKIKSITGNILDEKKLLAALKKHKPDIIFHLAAQPIVRLSYDDPKDTFITNIVGTLNVLETSRKVPSVKAVVLITSDKCYHNFELERGYTEGDHMGGHDPYSASKGAAEILIHAYRHSFFHPDKFGKDHNTLVASVRAGNVIGGGDWAKDRLIPDIARAANKNKVTLIRNPHATRPWQHVLEPLSGYLAVGAKLLKGKKEFAEPWNFGPNDDAAIPVAEVTEHTKKHWQKIKYKIEKSDKNPHEAKFLSLDSSKARSKLKWKSVWSKDKTFEKTIKWYKHFYDDGDVRTKDDLESYVRDAKQLRVAWAK